jgi:hypothetical protein
MEEQRVVAGPQKLEEAMIILEDPEYPLLFILILFVIVVCCIVVRLVL